MYSPHYRGFQVFLRLEMVIILQHGCLRCLLLWLRLNLHLILLKFTSILHFTSKFEYFNVKLLYDLWSLVHWFSLSTSYSSGGIVSLLKNLECQHQGPRTSTFLPNTPSHSLSNAKLVSGNNIGLIGEIHNTMASGSSRL